MKRSTQRPETASPCSTCPFLKSNSGKPNPPGYNPKTAEAQRPGQEFYDWYSAKNLLRLWRDGLRHGEAMICHATDPAAEEYGGKNGKPGGERLCTGSLVIVLRHIKHVERMANTPGQLPSKTRRLYRLSAGRYPMPWRGIVEWMMKFMISRTDLLGGLPLPAAISPEVIEACGVPWNDPLVNSTRVASDGGGDV